MKLSRLLVGLIALLWVVVFFATLLVVVRPRAGRRMNAINLI